MTRDELFTAVKLYLLRPNVEPEEFSLMLAMAEAEIARFLIGSSRNLTMAETAISNGVLTLPSDLLQLRAISTGKSKPLERRPTHALMRQKGGFYVRGNQVDVFPAAANGTLYRVDYLARIPPLTQDKPENWLSSEWPDVYLYGVLREGAIYYRKLESKPVWDEEFSRRLAEADAAGWKRSNTIVDKEQ